MSDGARDLLVRGIAAAKAGDREEARHFLEWALRQEPSSEEEVEAWLWLSEVAGEKAEARRWVEEVLANDPHNPRALRRLGVLDGRLQASDLINPDRPPKAPPSDHPIDIERFACPACGGPLAYAPDGNGLQCDHCGRRTVIAAEAGTVESAGDDFVLALATARGHGRPEASPTFACAGCGARFLMPAATLSLTCPYCDATYAVEGTDERLLIAPQAIIPLRVSLDEARQRLSGWLLASEGNRAFVIERLTAVYLPFWLLEMGGFVDWTILRSGGTWGGEENPLHGSEPPVSPISVLACARPKPGFAALVESTDPKLLIAFDSAYLAAHPAETYTLSMADAALRARQRALQSTGEKLKAESRGLPLSLRSARMVVTSYLLALAPVWLAEVQSGGTRRELVMSGVTGEVHTTDRPSRILAD